MAVKKLNTEKSIITFLLLTSLVVLGVSSLFLYKSIQRDELGGSFLSAMLIFISMYGLIVFIKRAKKYSFISKVQRAVLVENIYDINSLCKKFEKSSEKIAEEVKFLINNGFLSPYVLVGERIVDPVKERAKIEKSREQYIKEKVVEKPQQKTVIKEDNVLF